MKYLKANLDTPFSFSSCGNFTADDKWMHMERIIDTYEIILLNKGTLYIEQNNEKYILKEGDLLLLEAGCMHRGYDYSDKSTNFYWFHFSCNNAFSMIDNNDAKAHMALYKNNPYYDALTNSILIPTLAKNLNLDRINVLFRQLLHLSQSNYYTKKSADYALTSLLIEISEQVILNYENINKKNESDTISEIIQWIKMHTKKNISLKNVAYEFNFSKEYLARYFKNKMGMSMQEYINYLRISEAKQLLCKSDLKIKEISHELGFVDDKYFLKLFKRYENLTPKQYRNAYNKTFLNNV